MRYALTPDRGCIIMCWRLAIGFCKRGWCRMTAAYLDKQPELFEKWSKSNPLGRLGRPDELRGVVAWLASDASTFCTGSE